MAFVEKFRASGATNSEYISAFGESCLIVSLTNCEGNYFEKTTVACSRIVRESQVTEKLNKVERDCEKLRDIPATSD